MIHLAFTVDPVAKARPRVTRFGTYTPKKTKDFESLIKGLALLQYKGRPLEGALVMAIRFVIRKPKSVKRELPTVKPDLDNYLKAVKDALNGVVWKDDSQLVGCLMTKIYGEKGSIDLVVSPA